ncbi:MAG: hypothetical protein E7263_03340 [Lachnospiraceae bacterium]|nr:hypothetical protein [Lachnospiraceae bacterium]
MKIEHFLLEGLCDGEENEKKIPCHGTLTMGYHCLMCPKFSYTFCPNEIVLTNKEGVVVESIGFGGDMEPSEIENRKEYVMLWKEICKEKINEAYEEYMRRKNELS